MSQAGQRVPKGSRWHHLLVRLDTRGRVALDELFGPNRRLDGKPSPDRWRIAPSETGPFLTDGRGRLTIPVGLRLVLGLELSAGLSWRGDHAIVWAPRLLDAAIGEHR